MTIIFDNFMLAKPFIFFFTYVLTLANFIFLLLPVSFVLLPIILLYGDFFINVKDDLILLFIFIVSLFTVLHMLLEMIFGFTARRINKNSRRLVKLHHYQDIVIY